MKFITYKYVIFVRKINYYYDEHKTYIKFG